MCRSTAREMTSSERFSYGFDVLQVPDGMCPIPHLHRTHFRLRALDVRSGTRHDARNECNKGGVLCRHAAREMASSERFPRGPRTVRNPHMESTDKRGATTAWFQYTSYALLI